MEIFIIFLVRTISFVKNTKQYPKLYCKNYDVKLIIDVYNTIIFTNFKELLQEYSFEIPKRKKCRKELN